MHIKSKYAYVSQTVIDSGLWHIYRYAMNHYGTQTADIDTAPLYWYIHTGRASCDFLLKVFNAKPFMIARKLHEGGSYDEVIARLKKYLGVEG